MGISQHFYKKAKGIIPGGTQLLSKRPEMFLPDLWPAYYKRAKGCKVWDLDGKEYIDMSHMGVGSCILGYADREVDSSVKKAIEDGSMATLNPPEEVELAERLCNIHPWAEMVRFARTGGEAMAIAIRIARAKTGKELILFCGYHGWHDWYLAANIADKKALDGHLLPGLKPLGVPRSLMKTAIPFTYNDKSRFLRLAKVYKGRIAAVVMEPIRNYYPENGFLELIRDMTKSSKIPLVFDEITSGWRLNLGGAHLNFKIYPDICVFAKGISNGYPMSAVIGKRRFMNAAKETFISSTYWTERIGPVAALATIKKLERLKVARHLSNIGKKVQEGWKSIAQRHALDITVSGIYPLSSFKFNHRKHFLLKTLFTQSMLEKGFLATTTFYPSFAHNNSHIERYMKALDKTFSFISQAIKNPRPERYLKGTVCHSGFKRLT